MNWEKLTETSYQLKIVVNLPGKRQGTFVFHLRRESDFYWRLTATVPSLVENLMDLGRGGTWSIPEESNLFRPNPEARMQPVFKMAEGVIEKSIDGIQLVFLQLTAELQAEKEGWGY